MSVTRKINAYILTLLCVITDNDSMSSWRGRFKFAQLIIHSTVVNDTKVRTEYEIKTTKL